MDNHAFDQALMREAFELAGEVGWRRMGIAEAARRAGLPLDRARRRMPGKIALLLLLGRTADESALAEAMTEGSARDRLFDLLMQRLEVFQAHRAGIRALLHALPTEPPLALLLAAATRRSMVWMAEAAGVSSAGPRGCLRVQGLMGVWMWAVRAWERDDTPDLSITMAALDSALGRAERAAGWLEGRRAGATGYPDDDDAGRDEPDAGPDGDDTDLDPIAS